MEAVIWTNAVPRSTEKPLKGVESCDDVESEMGGAGWLLEVTSVR